MIKRLITKSYEKMAGRGWDKIYWAVDIHDTIITGNHDHENLPKVFLPFAREALQMLSARKDCVLILYTCGHSWDIHTYLDLFKENGIDFKYVNSNPEVEDTKYACFRDKFYTNIYLDDKAGFDPECHWEDILEVMKEMSEL